MNLTWKLTGTERLTLYYDSVEELGQLACFKRFFFFFFFASSRSDFKIEYVAFTLLTRGNSESDKSLNRFWIALTRKMTKKDNKAGLVSSFLYKIYQKFRLKCLLTFFSIPTLFNITPPYAERRESRFACYVKLNVRIKVKTRTKAQLDSVSNREL